MADVGNSSVVPDPTLDRVFFLRRDSATVIAFNRSNFTLVGALTIPGVSSFTVSSLVRWGDDGLAFRTAENQVFLIRIPETWFAASSTNRRRGQLTSQ